MRALRGIAGSLLWIVAALLLLVGGILSLTIILLPLGIPVFILGRKLMGVSIRLFAPRAIAHPVKQGRKSMKDLAGSSADRLRDSRDQLGKSGKRVRHSWKKVHKALT